MFAFFDLMIAGLASLYLWVFMSQLHTPGFRWLQHWLRHGPLQPLISCAWCSGWWLSVVIVLLLQANRLDWVVTPLTMVASAALAGFAGSLTPGIDLEDDEDAIT